MVSSSSPGVVVVLFHGLGIDVDEMSIIYIWSCTCLISMLMSCALTLRLILYTHHSSGSDAR